jgi:hypothetical protein
MFLKKKLDIVTRKIVNKNLERVKQPNYDRTEDSCKGTTKELMSGNTDKSSIQEKL